MKRQVVVDSPDATASGTRRRRGRGAGGERGADARPRPGTARLLAFTAAFTAVATLLGVSEAGRGSADRVEAAEIAVAPAPAAGRTEPGVSSGATSTAPAQPAGGPPAATPRLVDVQELAGLDLDPSAPEGLWAPDGRDPRESSRGRKPPLDPEVLARQRGEYDAERPKTALELQAFRRTSSMRIRGEGGRTGLATLVDVNPAVNEWYLLELAWSDGETHRLHLENARPEDQDLGLDPAFPEGIVLRRGGEERRCELWSERRAGCVADVAGSREPYARLCDGGVYVRTRTAGSRTAKEWAADFLRKNVWGGESIEVMVRDTVYGDAFLARPELAVRDAPLTPAPDGPGYPRPARTSPASAGDRLVPADLAIACEGGGTMVAGRWYRAAAEEGVFVSTIAPSQLAPELLSPGTGGLLDRVEADAVVYLIAFDLERFELGFELGTDHPDVAWSERARDAVRDPALPGPDGIGVTAPLAPTGLLPPRVADRVVATFAAGFKRRHSAFRVGALASVNRGSHYGFVSGGAVLSKLQPGLATLFALDDGRVEMKTWAREDDALLARMKFARQNGVPLLERDPATGEGVAGDSVGRWAEGNWAGSKDSKLRAVRAAAGIQGGPGRRFLLYAYFSSATPTAMARVLEAYGCEYAMHLDMNALEHTYLALYAAGSGKLEVEHLVRGMSVLEKTADQAIVPRFLGYADNRDFFYVLRRPGVPGPAVTGTAPAVGDDVASCRP